MINSNLINSNLTEPPLRVAILSDSDIQRTKLKQLLKTQGSQIVHEDTLGAYHPNDLANPTDVLLVDLTNASEISLQKIDELIEDNRIPILFNDGETIPNEDGPVRDDWVNTLTNKIFTLANRPVYKAPKKKKQMLQKNELGKLKSDNTPESLLKKDFPRTTIVSKSKTHRNILQNMLIHQGLTSVDIKSFDDVDIKKMQQTCDILILDQHNISKEDIKTYEMLKKQQKLGYIICNSSKLPLRSKDRQVLGIKLIKKLTSKASRCYVGAPNKTPNALLESKLYAPNQSTTNHSSSDIADLGLENKGVENKVSSIDVKTNRQTKTIKIEPIDISKSPLFKQKPAHCWADRLSDALAGVRRNLRSIERNKINLKGIKKPENDKTTNKANNSHAKSNIVALTPTINETTAKKKPLAASSNLIEKKKTSFFIEPIIKKVAQSAPIKNSAAENVKCNAKKMETDRNNNLSILDIYNNMVNAIKRTPSEPDSNISMFADSADNSMSAKLSTKQSAATTSPLQLSEKVPAQTRKKLSKKKSVQKNEMSNFSHADLEFSQELFTDNMQSDSGELEFGIELNSLKENLDISQNDQEEISMFIDANTVEKEKSGKIFGIDWSNPFKSS